MGHKFIVPFGNTIRHTSKTCPVCEKEVSGWEPRYSQHHCGGGVSWYHPKCGEKVGMSKE